MNATQTDEPRPPSALEALDADPASRKRFLKAVGGTAAAGLFATVLAACGSTKEPKPTEGGSDPNTAAGVGTDQYGKGDLGIARFLVTLEFIEVDFYDQAIASGKLTGRALDLAKRFGAQEKQHEQALSQAIGQLGGTPPPRIKANFPLDTQNSILGAAVDIEGLGAAALLAQLGRVENQQLLAGLFTLHSVEGRHVGALETLRGNDPAAQGAFAQPAFASDVINQLHSLVAPG